MADLYGMDAMPPHHSSVGGSKRHGEVRRQARMKVIQVDPKINEVISTDKHVDDRVFKLEHEAVDTVARDSQLSE